MYISSALYSLGDSTLSPVKKPPRTSANCANDEVFPGAALLGDCDDFAEIIASESESTESVAASFCLGLLEQATKDNSIRVITNASILVTLNFIFLSLDFYSSFLY